MPGRYTLRQQPSEVATSDGNYAIDGLPVPGLPRKPRYNIAPTQNCLVLRKGDQPRQLKAVALRWGLIPSWAKSDSNRSPLINARCEEVGQKPSFQAAFKRRRCLIPADGFYEWKSERGGSMPYFLQTQEQSIFYMAAIWESWQNESCQSIESFALLTTRANNLLAKWHDRMPVILRRDHIATWLEQDVSQLPADTLLAIFSPFPGKLMSCQPANQIVNNYRSEGPACLEAPAPSSTAQLDLEL